MKIVFRCMIFVFVALTLSAFAGVGLAQQAPAGPVVQVPESSFDFGEVIDGKDYVHDFKIKNVGSSDLVLKKVLPSCGTALAHADKVIPPGGEGRVSIRYLPKGCTGGTKKSTLVLTNDPNVSYFVLIVQGKPGEGNAIDR